MIRHESRQEMSRREYEYDLLTIGAGSGGVRASHIAASCGARVAIAEEDRIGGTCVIRGCVPKKLFVYAAQISEDLEDAAGYGWDVAAAGFSWRRLVANKDREIARLSALYEKNLLAAGVVIHRRCAEVTGPHQVRLLPGEGDSEARDISAERILIATGARPSLPADIIGIEHAITSDDAFHLAELPERIAIIGGGYIAVEFAGIFNGLGVATSLFYRGDEILRGFDDDLRTILHEEMAAKGIKIHLHARIAGIAPQGGSYRLHFHDGSSVETDLVMCATGRRPNTEKLGLERAGIRLTANNAVAVDENFHSGCGGIHAIGDAIDRMQLTPVAIREGAIFARNAFAPEGARHDAMNYEFTPTAVFSQPALSTVGLTEAEARQRHGEVDVYESRFRPMRHTLSGRGERMYVKLLVTPAGSEDAGRVLGAHLIGRDTAEMIQLLAVILRQGATKADFDATIAVHPTAAEELVTLTRRRQAGNGNA